ncbi:hypothetical protein ACQRIT_003935 [Beauveria bassiana]
MADSEAPATGSKRRRIALACTSCRTRKSRCDGRRPTCSTCHQLGFECQYDAPDSTANIIIQKDYVSGLEQRLQHVENLIQRHDDLLTGHLSSCVPTREYCQDLPGGPLPLRDAHTSDGMEIDASIVEFEDSGTEMNARTDGLAITFVDERAAAYFGESSNIGFVRYLVASISAIWGTYSAFKAGGFNKVRQTWLGELNLMFAIASNINRKQGKTSKQCFQESLIYYKRAMSLCGASSLRIVSLDNVQFLLLQALYLQAHMTIRLPQPWHVPENFQSCNETEVAQVATDFLSLSVQLYQIMGLSIEAQYNGNLGTDQSEDEVSMLQTASTLRQKLRRWAETLPSAFSLLPSSSPELKHSSRMNKLRAITTVRYHSVSILIHRPLLCVTLKYLSKINGRHDTELPYTTQLAMAEAFECISSAEETIGMAASVFGGGPVEDGNLGVWFFTLYYVFTAALVVCGGMLCARHSHRMNAQTVLAQGRLNLVKAADALENLDNSNPLVERCVMYIRYLSKLQDYRSDSGIFDAPSEEFDTFQHMDGVDFMRMVDLLDDDSGLGPYLAAELFDASTIDSLTLPL